MWRFLLISFAVMGWAFYQLSGGADYRPAPNSLQAWAQYGHKRPVQRPVQINVIALAPEVSDPDTGKITQTVTSLAELETVTRGIKPKVHRGPDDLVNTRADSEQKALEPVAYEDALLEARVAQIPSLAEPSSVLASLETAAALPATSPDPANPVIRDLDLRHVVGNAVNVRAGPGLGHRRVASLARDAQVTVLQDPGDGWLEVRIVKTGDTGWMSDLFVTSRN